MRRDAEKYQKISRVSRNALLILFSVAFAYFILFPIVVWLCFRFEILRMGKHYPLLESFDVPLRWLGANCKPYQQLLDFMADLII